MTSFVQFSGAVNARLKKLTKQPLYVVDIDGDTLWQTYLKSFPEGTDPIFRKRTEHDCSCCRQFIKKVGGIVAIEKNKLVSIWDIKIGGHYQVVADALANLVKKAAIANKFLTNEFRVSVDRNFQQIEDGQVLQWNHFYFVFDSGFVRQGEVLATELGQFRTSKEVFKRSLDSITDSAVDTVLELIEQNSLYRGAENKTSLGEFRAVQRDYQKLRSDSERDNYCWANASRPIARIRNTAIGTLLVDLSEGMELDQAVRSFESKVAPTNYKRPKALVTKKMIEGAQQAVEKLGLMDSLARRYATVDDIAINDVLFADRSIKQAKNVFDELSAKAPDKIKNLDKVEEVDVDTFVNNILPKARSIELMVENRHENNFVSLIAPVHPEAPPLTKWANNFSWAYKGEVTDSIAERVKKAGGSVTGILRCSLSWSNYDDLDIHVIEPDGNIIYFGKKTSIHSGKLDVDMNAGSGKSRSPVENVTWSSSSKILEGNYVVKVNNFCKREMDGTGFEVELEANGEKFNFPCAKNPGNKQTIKVAKFEYSRANGIKLLSSLPSTQQTKEVWGVSTQKFHKVSLVMQSPNYWNDQKIGNRHLFFMLDGCKNEEKARGFFNEFLPTKLEPHRKVLELLGAQMKTEYSDNQLSGLGFSTTMRNSVLCRVEGSFTRVVKIKF